MEPTADLFILSRCELQHGERIRGAIYNDTRTTGMHPFADGTVVKTTPMISINTNNSTFTTKSGTTYRFHVANADHLKKV